MRIYASILIFSNCAFNLIIASCLDCDVDKLSIIPFPSFGCISDIFLMDSVNVNDLIKNYNEKSIKFYTN